MYEGAKPCRVLVADPPWAFDQSIGKRGARANYTVIPTRKLIRFPLPPIMPDAYLFLWRVASMQIDALQVMHYWGFTLKGELVWDKVTRTGKPHFGMGFHLRASHEVALLGVRGKPKPKARNVRSRFEGVVREHSRKPSEFYPIVEAFSDGPYTELFSRQTREGWQTFGDQVDKFAR